MPRRIMYLISEYSADTMSQWEMWLISIVGPFNDLITCAKGAAGAAAPQGGTCSQN